MILFSFSDNTNNHPIRTCGSDRRCHILVWICNIRSHFYFLLLSLVVMGVPHCPAVRWKSRATCGTTVNRWTLSTYAQRFSSTQGWVAVGTTDWESVLHAQHAYGRVGRNWFLFSFGRKRRAVIEVCLCKRLSWPETRTPSILPGRRQKVQIFFGSHFDIQ